MKQVYLVRHGEAEDDINQTYGGWADDPLTDNGRKLAKELAEEIKKLNPKKIFSSPLKRAKVTAEIIGNHLGIPVEVVVDLKERNRYGVLTGMKIENAKIKHSELTEKVKDYKTTIEGAETYENFRDRAIKVLNKIIQGSDENVLIVTHGGVFRVAMWEMLERPDFVAPDLHAIIHLVEEGGKLSLKNSKGLNFKK